MLSSGRVRVFCNNFLVSRRSSARLPDPASREWQPRLGVKTAKATKSSIIHELVDRFPWLVRARSDRLVNRPKR